MIKAKLSTTPRAYNMGQFKKQPVAKLTKRQREKEKEEKQLIDVCLSCPYSECKSGFVNPFAIKSEIIQKACVSNELIISYSENYKKDVYSMHISDLKVYDKPKELGEFFTKGECSGPHCDGCKNGHIGQGWLDGSYYDEDCCINNGLKRISRPPQNFMFVEDLI